MRVAGDPRLRGEEGDIKEVKREEGREGKRGNREFHFEACDLASGEGLRSFPLLPSFLRILPHMMSPITPSRRPRRRPAKFLSLFTKGGGSSTALAAGY